MTAGWILFRADTLTDAGVFVQALAGLGASPSLNNPLPLTGGVQLALLVGAVAAVPLLPAVSRWTVTVDAIATALQMIVSAAAMFVWTRVLGQGAAPGTESGRGRPSEQAEVVTPGIATPVAGPPTSIPTRVRPG